MVFRNHVREIITAQSSEAALNFELSQKDAIFR